MQEKRQYVRMKTVFPVELELYDERGEKCSKHLLQGFSRDVSAGGICIELKSFGKQTDKELSAPKLTLQLTINPPFAKKPVQATARVVWIKKVSEDLPAIYFIGAAYTHIDSKSRARLIRYAQRIKWLPRITAILALVLMLLVGGLFAREQKLILENNRLVQQLIQSAEKKSDASSRLLGAQMERVQLAKELKDAEEKIIQLEKKVASAETGLAEEKAAFEKELRLGRERQKDLSLRVKSAEINRQDLAGQYQTIQDSEKRTASSALYQMYQWIKTHRYARTGLVASFEGDPSLDQIAFTYDQSLVVQVFLVFGDTEEAKAILDFYASKAEKEEGAFLNAYNSLDGSPVESLVHSGPNIWVGIAAAQYESRVHDGRFVPLIRSLADWVLQSQDHEGGLKGGPRFTWYSTEHNLDAYAFLGMTHQITKDTKYIDGQQRVLSWIRKYAYSASLGHMNRGKGDSTIATDTFSWAIAAIGPETLKKSELDPEEIMNFAEEHCKVTVSYKQPGGKVAKATGFDFAKAQNVGRGGIISTEWTSQVIVSMRILSEYFDRVGDKEKSGLYADKTEFYLNELQKLLVTSPSRTGQGRGCLPYASVDNADTGHGWRTPKGPRTGSVAGTAYGIFAWTGFNPFDLNSKVEISKPKITPSLSE